MAQVSVRSDDAESLPLRSAQEPQSPSAVGISERRIQYYFQASTIPRLGTQRPPPNCRWRLESDHKLESQLSITSEFVVEDDGTRADDYVEGDTCDAEEARQRSFAVRTVTFSEDSIPTFGLVSLEALRSQQETGAITDEEADEDTAVANGQKHQLELEVDALATNAFPASIFEESITSSKSDAGHSASFKTNFPKKAPLLRIKTGSGPDTRQTDHSHPKSMPPSFDASESETRGRSNRTEPRARGYASPTVASSSKSPVSQQSTSSTGGKRSAKSNVPTPPARNTSKNVGRSASADYSSQDVHASLIPTRSKGYAAPTASSSRRITSNQNNSRLPNEKPAQNSKIQGSTTALASPKTPSTNSSQLKSGLSNSESEQSKNLKIGQDSAKVAPGDGQAISPRRAGYNAPTLSSLIRSSSNQPVAESATSPPKNNSRENNPIQAVKSPTHPRTRSHSPKSPFKSSTDGAPVILTSDIESPTALLAENKSNHKRSVSYSAATKASLAKRTEAGEPSPDRKTAESQQKRFERVVKRQLSVPLKSADQLGPTKNESPKESLFAEGSRHVFTSHDGIITPASLRSRQSTDQSQGSFLHEMKQFGQTISKLALQDAFEGALEPMPSVPKEGFSTLAKTTETVMQTKHDTEKEHVDEKSRVEEPGSRGSFSSADETHQTRSFELPGFYVEEFTGKSFLTDKMSIASSVPQLPTKVESLQGSMVDISSSSGSTTTVTDVKISSSNAGMKQSKLNPNGARPKRDNPAVNPGQTVSWDFGHSTTHSEVRSARTSISFQNERTPARNPQAHTETNSPSSKHKTNAPKTELHVHLSRNLKGLNSQRNWSESSLADFIEQSHGSASDLDNTTTKIRRNSKSNPDFLSTQPNATVKGPSKVVPASAKSDAQQIPSAPSPVPATNAPSPNTSQRDFLCGFHKESLNLLLKAERPSRLPLPTGNAPRSTRSHSFSVAATSPSAYPNTISRIGQTNRKVENSNGITSFFNMNQVSTEIQTLTNKAKLHIFTTIPRTRSKTAAMTPTTTTAATTARTESPFLDTTPVEGYLKAAATTRHGRSPSGNGRETQFSIRPTISRSPFSATALLPHMQGGLSTPSKT
ncbi:hypothetical protein HDU78_004389 [Chytriomyces hyalinus]|nr:hypothetical protein HDU78_004389 [Chytriomyces hyalinus]